MLEIEPLDALGVFAVHLPTDLRPLLPIGYCLVASSATDQLIDAEGTVLVLLATLQHPTGSQELGQTLPELGLLFNFVRVHLILCPASLCRHASLYCIGISSSYLFTTAVLDFGRDGRRGRGRWGFSARCVHIGPAVDYSDNLRFSGRADELHARLLYLLLFLHTQHWCLPPLVLLRLYLRTPHHHTTVLQEGTLIHWIFGDESSLVKIGWGVPAEGKVIRLLGLLIVRRVVIYPSEDAHGLHVHTTDAPKKGLLQIFLDESLVIFILLVLPSGLCQFFPEHLHLLLEATYYISHL